MVSPPASLTNEAYASSSLPRPDQHPVRARLRDRKDATRAYELARIPQQGLRDYCCI